ncbi:protein kinase domain-containing protein [Sorangium sp. So ce1000]|uniref:serine/threonine-protein kinase n=1 Tax=Sorangium sp. So ce1000 TaxID=3133325 RepID=UPI003F60B78B
MSIAAGQVLSERYRLIRPVGQGAQAAVWVAEHLALGTQVAVKLIDPELAKQEDARERFRREATAAAQLRSAHVVQIIDHGIDGEQPFIVMELLEGEDLFDRLARRRRLSLQETSKIMTQVARALTRAHGAGIVHRDLKPENFFLCANEDDEIVKILDFGIAKVRGQGKRVAQRTSVGTLMGTPHYMSPEQVKGLREVDYRADLWALGVIVYQCVTGELPFDSEGVGDLLIKISLGEIPVPSRVNPELPPSFDAWFARACDRDPGRRFSSARDLAEALARVVDLSAEAPSSVSSPRPPPLPPRAAPTRPPAAPPRPATGSVIPKAPPLPRMADPAGAASTRSPERGSGDPPSDMAAGPPSARPSARIPAVPSERPAAPPRLTERPPLSERSPLSSRLGERPAAPPRPTERPAAPPRPTERPPAQLVEQPPASSQLGERPRSERSPLPSPLGERSPTPPQRSEGAPQGPPSRATGMPPSAQPGDGPQGPPSRATGTPPSAQPGGAPQGPPSRRSTGTPPSAQPGGAPQGPPSRRSTGTPPSAQPGGAPAVAVSGAVEAPAGSSPPLAHTETPRKAADSAPSLVDVDVEEFDVEPSDTDVDEPWVARPAPAAPEVQAPAAPTLEAQAPAAPTLEAQAPAAPTLEAQAPAAPTLEAQAPAESAAPAPAATATALEAQAPAAPTPEAQAPAEPAPRSGAAVPAEPPLAAQPPHALSSEEAAPQGMAREHDAPPPSQARPEPHRDGVGRAQGGAVAAVDGAPPASPPAPRPFDQPFAPAPTPPAPPARVRAVPSPGQAPDQWMKGSSVSGVAHEGGTLPEFDPGSRRRRLVRWGALTLLALGGLVVWQYVRVQNLPLGTPAVESEPTPPAVATEPAPPQEPAPPPSATAAAATAATAEPPAQPSASAPATSAPRKRRPPPPPSHKKPRRQPAVDDLTIEIPTPADEPAEGAPTPPAESPSPPASPQQEPAPPAE